MPKILINRILQGLLIAGLVQAAPVWASTPASGLGGESAPMAVGEVNLALGKAFIVHADGSRERAKAGVAVAVGDRVETQGNAHVHIRFIDAALVSVRPLSRLEIQRYEYRAEDPSASAVKFNLIEGVTRAISGEAAKSARQNFRLNTPVAAIGVRGTDFVVRADQGEARAVVNEGAIVMAPFSATCLVDALGPCSDNGLELAGGAQAMAMVVANAAEPVLVTANGGGATESFLAGAAVRADSSEATDSKQADEESGNNPYTESVSNKALTQNLPAKPVPPSPPAPPPVTPPSYTPPAPLPDDLLASRQLVWGRYDESAASSDLLAVANTTAGLDRAITVGNDAYALYRYEQGGAKSMQPGLGVMDFDLEYAQAFYSSDLGKSPVDVLGGTLSIDFGSERFQTRLDMSQEQMGNVSFEGSGHISGAGYFNDRSRAGQYMFGAAGQDGSEAAYFFEKTLQNGLLEGLTLWGSGR